MTGGGVALAGWSLYLPGADLTTRLPEFVAAQPARAAEPVYPPEHAARVLGRKGLLNRDPATRLALCAAHRALGRPDGAPRDTGSPQPRVAVVASSNLGNVAAVSDVVGTVRTGGYRAVSPLGVANASSNIIASAVAIRFRCGGPNLMLCAGATSGLDALAAGALLLRAGRCDRVVVVGVEPVDETTTRLHPGGVAGAACVLLVRPGDAPGAPVLGPVRAVPAPPGISPALDLTTRYGDLYGALGVAQAAVAAALTTAGGPPVRLACGDETDGWRTAEVTAAATVAAPTTRGGSRHGPDHER